LYLGSRKDDEYSKQENRFTHYLNSRYTTFFNSLYLSDVYKQMTYFQIDGLLIITNKNATKSPGHQSPPRINTLTLVKFGVLVFWWQNGFS